MQDAATCAAVAADGHMPFFLSLSGSDTARLAVRIEATASWPIGGYLVSCPYYSRPSQQGLYHHFTALAGVTDRPMLMYNIPYRTGVNLANDTALALAEIPNIVGIKDCLLEQLADFRPDPATAGRFFGHDRRGRALPRCADQRRGRSHPCRGTCRNCPVRRCSATAACRRHANCAGLMACNRRLDTPAVRRAEPGGHQALAVAAGPDRQSGTTFADDRCQLGSGNEDRLGDGRSAADIVGRDGRHVDDVGVLGGHGSDLDRLVEANQQRADDRRTAQFLQHLGGDRS